MSRFGKWVTGPQKCEEQKRKELKQTNKQEQKKIAFLSRAYEEELLQAKITPKINLFKEQVFGSAGS